MDYQERDSLIRRINSRRFFGRLEYAYEFYDVLIDDPNQDILCEADWLYKIKYAEYRDKDCLTIEESYKVLTNQGLWSAELEKELETLNKNIKDLKLKLPSLKFLKNQQRLTKQTIENARKRIEALTKQKNQLWPHTIEYACLSEKRKFIVSKITKLSTNNHLLTNPHFLTRLSVYYYEENAVSDTAIRELARTDPWRLYWTVSKETGTSLFPHSSVEMTEMQYALVTWSRIYDFAYESQNRPPDEVISDDDQFDAWYDGECTRIKSEINKSHSEPYINGGLGSQEVFIPADEEGAKEVYALNNPDARMRIAQREKSLQQHGALTEANLPDVKRDLQIAASKMTK